MHGQRSCSLQARAAWRHARRTEPHTAAVIAMVMGDPVLKPARTGRCAEGREEGKLRVFEEYSSYFETRN